MPIDSWVYCFLFFVPNQFNWTKHALQRTDTCSTCHIMLLSWSKSFNLYLLTVEWGNAFHMYFDAIIFFHSNFSWWLASRARVIISGWWKLGVNFEKKLQPKWSLRTGYATYTGWSRCHHVWTNESIDWISPNATTVVSSSSIAVCESAACQKSKP